MEDNKIPGHGTIVLVLVLVLVLATNCPCSAADRAWRGPGEQARRPQQQAAPLVRELVPVRPGAREREGGRGRGRTVPRVSVRPPRTGGLQRARHTYGTHVLHDMAPITHMYDTCMSLASSLCV